MANKKYIVNIGDVFGRLKVIALCSSNKNSATYHTCICECGTVKEFSQSNIVLGKSKSCGCLSREITRNTARTHGKSKTDEYMTWNRMWARCTNPKVNRYPRYGGRGIKVCDRWKKFENFFEDMGLKPSKKHSIDRIDTDGNYEPSNCRWGTAEDQRRSMSTTKIIEWNGESLSMAEWDRKLGLPASTICQRMSLGMKPPELFSTGNLNVKNITVDGITKMTTEWMKDAKIPISSFYLNIRKGLTPEEVVRKYKAKLKKQQSR